MSSKKREWLSNAEIELYRERLCTCKGSVERNHRINCRSYTRGKRAHTPHRKNFGRQKNVWGIDRDTWAAIRRYNRTRKRFKYRRSR